MTNEELQDKIVERMTGVDRTRILEVRKGNNPYGVPILLILQIIAALVVIIPKIVEWWNNRRSSFVARAYIMYVVKKELIKDGKRDVSAFALSNAIYATLKELE